MLEAKLYKGSFITLKNKSLDLSNTEKVSKLRLFFFFFNIQLYLNYTDI